MLIVVATFPAVPAPVLLFVFLWEPAWSVSVSVAGAIPGVWIVVASVAGSARVVLAAAQVMVVSVAVPFVGSCSALAPALSQVRARALHQNVLLIRYREAKKKKKILQSSSKRYTP